MRKTSIAALAFLVAMGACAARAEPDDLSLRVAIMRLANQGMRLQAGQAIHVARHGAPAATVEALVADGAVRAEPTGSEISRTAGGTPAAWRFPGPSGDAPEIAIAADGLDGPVCREVARLSRLDGPFGCAAGADGIVFRYGEQAR